MENIIENKSIKKSIFLLLSFLVILLPFSDTRNTALASEKFNCKDGQCLEVPTSNVSEKEYKNILNKVKKTEEYKKLSKEYAINSLKKEDIVINKAESETQVAASVGFIFGEKMENNLAYIEIGYDLSNESVYAEKLLYGEEKENGLLDITMVVNGELAFSMDINKKGEIIGENGEVINQDDFYQQAVDEMNKDEYTTFGWCEWTVAALCGAGGGAGCYALAIGLGLTTGIGGLGLATVCALIASLGCTAATIKICD